MQENLPVVVLVGRPNVGKSTLFNHLTGSRDALVADRPGVTRDRQYGFARHDGKTFLVVDTGGLGQEDVEIDELARRQTELALEQADAVAFVVDGADGLHPADHSIARRLRRLDVPIFTVVNKVEGQPREQAVAEFHALGLGQPWAVSARRGDRLVALQNRLLKGLPQAGPRPGRGQAVHLAIIGRPNAGKSTLVNRLLGYERMLALDVPGTTRDAVSGEFEFEGEPFVVVDTAGIRRRPKVRDSLERLTVVKALQAVEKAHVAVLLVDARSGLTSQDARLLRLIVERHRAAVVAVNKWDGLDGDYRGRLRNELAIEMPFRDFVPLHFISALHGSGLKELMLTVRSVHDNAFRDLPTPQLTRVLERAVVAHSPPAVQGRRIKLRYAHQGGRDPLRIVIHGNQTQKLSAEYRRYLESRFRKAFGLTGVPLQLIFRSGDNPYHSG